MHLPSAGPAPLHFTHLNAQSICLVDTVQPGAEVTFICKVTASIKDTDAKHNHMAISENAVLFFPFISALVIAVTSLGPDLGTEICVLAWLSVGSTHAPHSHKTGLF